MNNGSIPRGWKTCPLPDVVFFQEGPGVQKHQYTDSGVKLLNVGNLNDGRITLETTSRYVSEEEAYGRYKHFLVDDGDLLIGSSGVTVDTFHRKIAFVGKEHLPLCMNTSTIRFKVLDPNVLDINFFRLFLTTPIFKGQLRRLITGSAQLNFGPSHLRQMEIPLPPLSEQKRIADILDKADTIRRKRQEAVSVHGTLGTSVFIEFFGDPLTNPQGWKLETLETVSSQDGRGLKRGPFGGALKKEIFVDQGFKVYEQKHAIANDFTIGSYYIDDDKFDEMEAFSVRPDDLIVSCSGTMGRVAIVPESAEPGIINQALLRISPDTSKVSSLYLKMLLETTPVQRHLYGFSRGSGLKNFPPMSEVRSLPVPIPSQERLAAFHEYMDQTTCTVEKLTHAEKAAEDLFNSLVQSAFKGEL